jgi:hypothetical protein
MLNLEEMQELHFVYFIVEILKVIFYEIPNCLIKQMKWAVKDFSEGHSRCYIAIP